MSDSEAEQVRRPVVLGPGEGRAYPMGPLSAVFKAAVIWHKRFLEDDEIGDLHARFV